MAFVQQLLSAVLTANVVLLVFGAIFISNFLKAAIKSLLPVRLERSDTYRKTVKPYLNGAVCIALAYILGMTMLHGMFSAFVSSLVYSIFKEQGIRQKLGKWVASYLSKGGSGKAGEPVEPGVSDGDERE
jgi:hypothetical protein